MSPVAATSVMRPLFSLPYRAPPSSLSREAAKGAALSFRDYSPAPASNGPILLRADDQHANPGILLGDVFIHRRSIVLGLVQLQLQIRKALAHCLPHSLGVLSNSRRENQSIKTTQGRDHGSYARPQAMDKNIKSQFCSLIPQFLCPQYLSHVA